MAPIISKYSNDRRALPIGRAVLLFCAILCIELGGVVGYNLFLKKLHIPPLIFTAIQRIIMASLIIGMTIKWGNGLESLGLSKYRVRAGFKQGMLWSLGFGLLVGFTGSVFFIFGINPVSLISSACSWTTSKIITYILIGCVLGPAVEDLVFVGLLYNSIRTRLNLVLSVLGIATIFALAHGLFAFSLIIQFTGGLLFVLSFESSDSLIAPMIIHCLGNMALLALQLL